MNIISGFIYSYLVSKEVFLKHVQFDVPIRVRLLHVSVFCVSFQPTAALHLKNIIFSWRCVINTSYSYLLDNVALNLECLKTIILFQQKNNCKLPPHLTRLKYKFLSSNVPEQTFTLHWSLQNWINKTKAKLYSTTKQFNCI